MAYDRYDTRRDRERGYNPDYDRDRGPGRSDERGFFERAGDEVSSWFGDEEAERRRRQDERMERSWGRDDDRMNRSRDPDRDFYDRDRYAYRGSRPDWQRGRSEDEDRGPSAMNRSRSDRDYRSGSSGGWSGAFTGSDYDRSDFDRGGNDRWERAQGRGDHGRSDFGERDTDRSYRAWRQRKLDELDRDYDDYRRENQERFESDFGSWRQNRQQKRGLLGEIREHMDVVGSDGETIGKVDKVCRDHIVLTKSDSDDNRHHSIKCTLIDKVKGDKVRLEVPAEEAKSRWKDEDERGFFGRDDDDGDVSLERSFSGTYR